MDKTVCVSCNKEIDSENIFILRVFQKNDKDLTDKILNYHSKKIDSLEDRIESLEKCQEKMIELIKQIADINIKKDKTRRTLYPNRHNKQNRFDIDDKICGTLLSADNSK